MIKYFLILISVLFSSFTHNFAQNKIEFHSPGNIKLFADYLFCEKDYLRAYDEYKSYLDNFYSDTVEFKAAVALQKIGSFDEALRQFNNIPLISGFYTASRIEILRTLFLENDFRGLNNIFMKTDSTKTYYSFLSRLNRISLLYSENEIPRQSYFILPFPEQEKNLIKKFYNRKVDPPDKSPVLAGILSTIIPGLGKVYTENYADGLFAALLTGVFGYIAYTDFNADHRVRGWIFSGVAAFFYAGNIYGSVAAAQIYNAKLKFNFKTELHDFLDAFHYLSGVYNFCK